MENLWDHVVERIIEGDVWRRILPSAKGKSNWSDDEVTLSTSWVNATKANSLGITGGQTRKLLSNKLIMCESCLGNEFEYDDEGIDWSSLICKTPHCTGGIGVDYCYFYDLVDGEGKWTNPDGTVKGR